MKYANLKDVLSTSEMRAASGLIAQFYPTIRTLTWKDLNSLAPIILDASQLASGEPLACLAIKELTRRAVELGKPIF